MRAVSANDPMIAMPTGETRKLYRLESEDRSLHASLRATILEDGSVIQIAGTFRGEPYSVPQVERMFVIQ